MYTNSNLYATTKINDNQLFLLINLIKQTKQRKLIGYEWMFFHASTQFHLIKYIYLLFYFNVLSMH